MIPIIIIMPTGILGGITRDGDFSLATILGTRGGTRTIGHTGDGGIMITTPIGITRVIFIPTPGSFKEDHLIGGLHIKERIPTIGW